MRSLDATQLSYVSSRETMPIYLVEINIAGRELLSTNGDRTVGDLIYRGGDVAVAGLNNWTSGRIRLQATPTRVAQVVAKGWRNTVCKIWLLPAVSYPRLIEEGYYEGGYGIEGVNLASPVLLLDGVLTGAQSGEAVEFEFLHRALVARYVPGIRLAAPICNHLPRAGTSYEWNGNRYTIEAAA